MTITSTTIHSNEAHDGGGMHIAGGTVTITATQIYSNEAVPGGGIHIDGGTVAIASTTIHSNHADWGGGIHLDGGTVTITSSTIYFNEASGGGGMYGAGGTLFLGNGTAFFDSSASGVGANLHLPGSVAYYTFPVTPGHWLPNSECRVYREPCTAACTYNSDPDCACYMCFDACSLHRSPTSALLLRHRNERPSAAARRAAPDAS